MQLQNDVLDELQYEPSVDAAEIGSGDVNQSTQLVVIQWHDLVYFMGSAEAIKEMQDRGGADADGDSCGRPLDRYTCSVDLRRPQ